MVPESFIWRGMTRRPVHSSFLRISPAGPSRSPLQRMQWLSLSRPASTLLRWAPLLLSARLHDSESRTDQTIPCTVLMGSAKSGPIFNRLFRGCLAQFGRNRTRRDAQPSLSDYEQRLFRRTGYVDD